MTTTMAQTITTYAVWSDTDSIGLIGYITLFNGRDWKAEGWGYGRTPAEAARLLRGYDSAGAPPRHIKRYLVPDGAQAWDIAQRIYIDE